MCYEHILSKVVVCTSPMRLIPQPEPIDNVQFMTTWDNIDSFQTIKRQPFHTMIDKKIIPRVFTKLRNILERTLILLTITIVLSSVFFCPFTVSAFVCSTICNSTTITSAFIVHCISLYCMIGYYIILYYIRLC